MQRIYDKYKSHEFNSLIRPIVNKVKLIIMTPIVRPKLGFCNPENKIITFAIINKI
jgi:hypothetical protein